MERGVIKTASDVKCMLRYMQKHWKKPHLEDFLPFLIASSMLEKMLVLTASEECVHVKYGSPEMSSSWGTAGSYRHTDKHFPNHLQ